MRSLIFASLSLAFGTATALAGDNPSQSPSPASAAAAAPSQASPAATSAPAASPGQPASSQPAPSPAAHSTAAHASDAQELTDTEKKLVAQGYKMSIKNGEKIFCRREGELGSHFERKVCGTAESLAATQRDAKDIAAQSQQSRGTNPLGN
jgi:hypothetical protein